ncbi:MAG: sigma-70 family RNA polymerase sigma factor [Proteobacteria bacterium]|nr:sigma-70 family RNA polymerase sigma factor [Pseudomonadota bacterium]
MTETDIFAERFEAARPRLRAVAYRMLGSGAEADDAVQEAWLRLSRTGGDSVDNLPAWLTTVVSRVCLDMLRARRSRREEPIGPGVPEPSTGSAEDDALLADSVGMALLIVLDKLTPAERVAFVLHDMFDLPFDAIAPIVNRSPEAARQLASRARRRVQGASDVDAADLDRQNEMVNAFIAASRDGNFEALLTMLDPDVVMRADDAAFAIGGVRELHGANAVATTFNGRARAARPALVDGHPAFVVFLQGYLRIVVMLSFNAGRIAGIDAIADRARLGNFDIELLDE